VRKRKSQPALFTPVRITAGSLICLFSSWIPRSISFTFHSRPLTAFLSPSPQKPHTFQRGLPPTLPLFHFLRLRNPPFLLVPQFHFSYLQALQRLRRTLFTHFPSSGHFLYSKVVNANPPPRFLRFGWVREGPL